MLKPIKTFLTYLQRNANSSNIFGLTTAMGPTEPTRLEETMMIANDELTNEDADPLYDPLALDDECPGSTVAEMIDPSGDTIGNESQEGVHEGVEVDAGKIILVDVTTLKPDVVQNELETDDDNELEEEADGAVMLVSEEEMPHVCPTTKPSVTDEEAVCRKGDKGGAVDGEQADHLEESIMVSDQSTETILVSDQSTETISVSDECQEVKEVGSDCTHETMDLSSATANDSLPTEPAPSATITVCVSENADDDVGMQLEPSEVDTRDALDAADPISDVQQQDTTSVPGGRTTSDQIQGVASEAEEEEASDGSDSGLGLEPSREVATTEAPPTKSSLKRRSEPPGSECGAAALEEKDDGVSSQKRIKKGITFEGVTVYYFPRIQGFGCVPSQGGCTLGMEFQHVHSRRLTLAEHSSEQRKVHRQQLQELNPRSSSSDDTSSEEEPSESGSEAESESYGFLQPVTTRQRRALLKAAGVRKIDPTEKDECREIRTSREVCGCTCRGLCDPATCACSLAGIKCQVDRPSFPCGCTQEGCANTAGRVEFNPARVRTHFIHTIMRLNLEDKANEVRRTGAMAGNGTGRITTGLGIAGDSSYTTGSEKNWSSGPIRLPPAMVYGAGMHSAPSAGVSGIMDDGLVPINHHSLPTAYHHQQHPPSLPMQNGLQAQHQHFALPPHLQHPAENYLPGQVYHNYLVANDAQLYLATPVAATSATTTAQHLIGGLTPPIAPSTESVDLHYGYRDYFGGASGTTTEQPLPHTQMFYNYGSSSTGVPVAGTTTTEDVSLEANHSHPHPQPSEPTPMAMHPVPGSGSISPYHSTAPTGHDRYVDALSDAAQNHLHSVSRMDSTDSKMEPSSSSSTVLDEADAAMQTSETSNTSLDTTAVLNRPAPDMVLDPAVTVEEGTDSTVRETLMESICLDSSLEIDLNDSDTVATDAVSPAKGKQSPPADGSGDIERQSGSPRSVAEKSCFIDLTAPPAENAERLEAINDMLASSRRTANLARRSIAAEDDDELRDFRHSPLLIVRKKQPPTPTVTIDDDTASDDDVVILSPKRTNKTKSAVDDAPLVSIADDDSEEQETLHQNGITTPNEDNALGDGKRIDTTRPCSPADELTANGTSESGNHSSEVTIVESNLIRSAVSEPLISSVDSSPSSGSPEPNENLCEIIKNSIVETALSH